MTNEELQQAIITVMVFDGWELKFANGVFYYENSEGSLIFEYEILAKYPIYEDWRLLHPVWEKFRDMKGLGKEFWVIKQNIGYLIANGTILEAFTALHSAIVWFNEINKKG
jgi:hypothetical protein